MTARPWPIEVRVRRADRILSVAFDTGETFEIPAPLLRVMTPAADARGHGPAPVALKPLAIDKSGVGVESVTAIGRYAIRVRFDDGYDAGLYTWDALYRIGRDRDALGAEHAMLMHAPH